MATPPGPAPRVTEAEFAATMARAGLAPSETELAEMYRAYAYIERMAERVRAPRGIEAEPAPIFVPAERGA